MFISDKEIEIATNQEKCKIMRAIITHKLAYIPNLQFKQLAKFNGCKEEDVKRFFTGL